MSAFLDRVEIPNPLNMEISPKTDINHEEVEQNLRQIRVTNINNIIIAYLNINTLSNKFDSLKLIIPGNVDITSIGETNLMTHTLQTNL